MPLQFYNTLTRKKEIFTPIDPPHVGLYSCGPTVYDYVHIGNLRAYTFADTLQKTLKYFGYKVKRVMNITDIGHLSSDADSGEDKMTKGLLREGKELTLKNMRELAEFYAEKFKDDLKLLNIEIPENICYASDYLREEIELIKKLEKKEYTYKTNDGIYFNVSKVPDYGILWGGKRSWNKEGARVAENSEKKNPEDFALWKFNSKIGFPSMWGQGFPGWHIECSAMSMKFLGEQFDIHTAGIDLLPTHHTNEIAQSESATGKKPFVRFWMHSEFIDIGGAKMAKSAGNFLKLSNISEKGINPLAYRFWLLMGHYRTKMNFNWEALEGAEIALKRLYNLYTSLLDTDDSGTGNIHQEYQNKFKEFMGDDLDTPRALSLLWDVFKDENISNADKKATILDFDKILGLGFENLKKEIIPEEIQKIARQRALAKIIKDFKKSDELRKKINSLGYKIEDNPSGEIEGQNISKL